MVREVLLVVIVPNLTDYHTRILVCYPPISSFYLTDYPELFDVSHCEKMLSNYKTNIKDHFMEFLFFDQVNTPWERARIEAPNNWSLSELSRSITSLHLIAVEFQRLWKVHWSQLTTPRLYDNYNEGKT